MTRLLSSSAVLRVAVPESLQVAHRASVLLSRAIYVACKLGVPDLCADTPRSAADLAAASGADETGLAAFLRVLAGEGLLEEDEHGGFLLTPLGGMLRRDVDGSLWPMVILSAELLEPTPAAALYTARTGRAAFEHTHRCHVYEHLAGHPDHDELFTAAMTGRAAHLHAGVVDAVDWTDVATVVDVGGAHGRLLAAVLERSPGVGGVLFDQPHVVAGADELLASSGIAERVRVAGGDFFVSVPPGGDVYLLANVLWNWHDDQAVTILRRCREAMGDAGRVVVAEPIADFGDACPSAARLSLVSLLLFGGRVRTAAEWTGLFVAAGFQPPSMVATDFGWGVIESRPVAA